MTRVKDELLSDVDGDNDELDATDTNPKMDATDTNQKLDEIDTTPKLGFKTKLRNKLSNKNNKEATLSTPAKDNVDKTTSNGPYMPKKSLELNKVP